MSREFDSVMRGNFSSDAQAGGRRLSNLVRGRHLAAQFLRELEPGPGSASEQPEVEATPSARGSAAAADAAEVRSTPSAASSGRSEGRSERNTGSLYASLVLTATETAAESATSFTRSPLSPSAYAVEPVPEPPVGRESSVVAPLQTSPVKPTGRLTTTSLTVDELLASQEERTRQERRINERFEEALQAHLSLVFRAWKRSTREVPGSGRLSVVQDGAESLGLATGSAFLDLDGWLSQSHRRAMRPDSVHQLIDILEALRCDVALRLHLKSWRQLAAVRSAGGSQRTEVLVAGAAAGQARAGLRIEMVRAGKASAVKWRMAVLAWHQEAAARRGTSFARVAEQINSRRRLRLEGGVWWTGVKREVILLSLTVRSWQRLACQSFESELVGAMLDAQQTSKFQRLHRLRACVLAARVAEWLTTERCKFLMHAVLVLWSYAVRAGVRPDGDRSLDANVGADAYEAQQMQEELLRLQQYLVKHFMWWVHRQELAEASLAFRAWRSALRQGQQPQASQEESLRPTRRALPESPSRASSRRSTVAQKMAAWSMERAWQNCIDLWKQRMLRDDEEGFKRLVMMVWLLVAVGEQRALVSERFARVRSISVTRRCRDVVVAFLKLLLNSWHYEAQYSNVRAFRQDAVRPPVQWASRKSNVARVRICWYHWTVQLFGRRAHCDILRLLVSAWHGYAAKRNAVAASVSWRPLHAWRRNFDAGLLSSAWYWWLRASLLDTSGRLRALWRILQWWRGCQEPSYQSAGLMPRAATHDHSVVQRVIAADFALLRSYLGLWRVAASTQKARALLHAANSEHVTSKINKHLMHRLLLSWVEAFAMSNRQREDTEMQEMHAALKRNHFSRAETLQRIAMEHIEKMLMFECLFGWFRFARSRWAERLDQNMANLKKWSDIAVSTAQAQSVKRDLLTFVFATWCQEALRACVHSFRARHPVALTRAAFSKAALIMQIEASNSLRLAWCIRFWRDQVLDAYAVKEGKVMHKRRMILLANLVQGCLSTADLLRMQGCWDSWDRFVRFQASERRNSRMESVMQTVPRMERRIGAERAVSITVREQLLQQAGAVFNAWASLTAADQALEDTTRLRKKYRRVGDTLSQSLLDMRTEAIARVAFTAWANDMTKNCSFRLMLRMRRGALWAVGRLSAESAKMVAKEAFRYWASAVVVGSGERAKELSQHLKDQASWVLERSSRAREHRHKSAMALAEALCKAHESWWMSAVLAGWHRAAEDSRAVVLQTWISDLEKQVASQAREIQIQDALMTTRSRGEQAPVDGATLVSDMQRMLADVQREAELQQEQASEQQNRIEELQQQLSHAAPLSEDERMLEELQQRLSNASAWEATLHDQRKDLEQQVMSARAEAEEQPADSSAARGSESAALVQRQQGDAIEEVRSARERRAGDLELQLSDACAQETMLRGQVADLKQQLESVQVLAKAGAEARGEKEPSRRNSLEIEQQLMEARELQLHSQEKFRRLSVRATHLAEELSGISSKVPMLPGPASSLVPPAEGEGAGDVASARMTGRSGTLSGRMTARSGSQSARMTGQSGPSGSTSIAPAQQLPSQMQRPSTLQVPAQVPSLQRISSARSVSTARETQEAQEDLRLQELLREMEEMRAVISLHEHQHAEELRRHHHGHGEELQRHREMHAEEAERLQSEFMSIMGSLMEMMARYVFDPRILQVAFHGWAIILREERLAHGQKHLNEAICTHAVHTHAEAEKRRHFKNALYICSDQLSASTQRGPPLRCIAAWNLHTMAMRQTRIAMARQGQRQINSLLARCLGGWRHVVVHEGEVKEAHNFAKRVHEQSRGLRQRDLRQRVGLSIGGIQQVAFVTWTGVARRKTARKRALKGAANLATMSERARMRAALLVWLRVRAESRAVEACNATTAVQIAEHAAFRATHEASLGFKQKSARRVAVWISLERSRRVAVICLAAWASDIIYRVARRSSALNAKTLFSGWARANSAVLLKSVFCVWIDVIIVVQTAALRLGIRQSVTSLETKVDPEIRFSPKSKTVRSLQAPGVPTSRDRVLATATVESWKGTVIQSASLDNLVTMVWRTATNSEDRTLKQDVWRAWSLSAIQSARSKADSEAKRLNRAVRSRCAFTSLWAVEVVAEREDFLESVVNMARAWRAWSQLARDNASMMGRRLRPMQPDEQIAVASQFEEHCHILVGITLALWSQEQQRSLARMTFALWFWSAGCLTLREGVERLRLDLKTVQRMAEKANRVIDESSVRMLRRCDGDKMAAIMSLCFTAWRRSQPVATQTATSSYEDAARIKQLKVTYARSVVENWCRSGERGLFQLCFFRWHEAWMKSRNAQRETDQAGHTRLTSFNVAQYMMESSGVSVTTSSNLYPSFLHWRLCSVGSLRQRQKDDLAMMVELLQQSTNTCKDLQSCLLQQRRDTAYATFFALRSVFQAWRGCVRPGIGAGRG